ncbi:unnamed protein product [Rhizopus stolonifer]
MISKIQSTLSNKNNERNEPLQGNIYEDCFTCRFIGAAAFGGLGGYALHQANELKNVPGKAKTVIGLGVAGVVFISAGLFRATI